MRHKPTLVATPLFRPLLLILPVLVLFAAMLIMYFTPQASVHLAKPVLSAATISLRRGIFFSARAQEKPRNNDAGTGWTGTGGPDHAFSSESVSLSASSTAYNYDKTTFGSLMAYHVAISFQPKDRKKTNIFKGKLQGNSPASLLPTGEDNLFVSAQSKDGYIALGVADGVGGWSEAGYDSAAISRELCHALKVTFELSASPRDLTPRKLLKRAFDCVQDSSKVETGGTTACLGVFTPDRKLKVANLGDSWCGLFRGHRLIEETQFQTHNFNTPFQLAKIPPQVLRQAELQGKRYIIDSPEMCDEYEWDLEKDDVVVFATDGVTDNVIPQDIELFLQEKFAQGKSLAEISALLVKEVVKVSKDPNYPSAFAQELSRLTEQRYVGGKEDDVTIVMVKVL